MSLGDYTKYYDENGEEISEEDYYNNDNAYCENDTPDIYQYYLCNIGQWDKEQCEKAGLIISYSDMLDCYVLCVDHYGTSWDYVLTDVPLFETYEDLKAFQEAQEVLNNE